MSKKKPDAAEEAPPVDATNEMIIALEAQLIKLEQTTPPQVDLSHVVELATNVRQNIVGDLPDEGELVDGSADDGAQAPAEGEQIDA